jgi:hypothetical protein
MWTSSPALVITPENRQALERLVRSGKTEHRIALRALIVLGAADGQSTHALAKALKTSRPKQRQWGVQWRGNDLYHQHLASEPQGT